MKYNEREKDEGCLCRCQKNPILRCVELGFVERGKIGKTKVEDGRRKRAMSGERKNPAYSK
jgi:hypothetical protein